MATCKVSGWYREVAFTAPLAATMLVGCYLETSADIKHASFSQARNPLVSWYFNRKILIKKVHDKKWRIGIKYDKNTNFTEEQKKELATAIEDALNVWLAPVHEYSKGYGGRDVVAKFEFTEIKSKPFQRYHPREQSPPIDVEITFKDGWGSSHWRPKVLDGIGMVRLFKGYKQGSWTQRHEASDSNKIPQDADTYYSWNILLHELGHAFGLDDTYPEGKRESIGGSKHTSGQHAESVMSAIFPDNKRTELTYDDIVGIQDLYRYYVLGYKNEKECASDEFTWSEDSNGCVPRHPVIFAVKYGNASIVKNILIDDPNVKVNEKNPLGNTALHEAIVRMPRLLDDENRDGVSIVGMVSTLLNKGVKVNIANNEGQTPLHLLANVEYSDSSELVLDSLLIAQADPTAKDNNGKTPYDYAKEHNDIADLFGVAKFPDKFLERLDPANIGAPTQE